MSSKRLSNIALPVAAIVAALTIVQAIRQDSWGPIWLIGWLPAVLVAVFHPPSSGKRRSAHKGEAAIDGGPDDELRNRSSQ